jgi:hypothetical protein
MKAKTDKNEARRERLLECLDAIHRHRANAGVLAGLLDYCDTDNIQGDLVSEAGVMIGAELEEVRVWIDRLHKELRELQ